MEKKYNTIIWYDYDKSGSPMGMRVNGQDYLFKKNGRVISKGCTIPTGSGSDLYLPIRRAG